MQLIECVACQMGDHDNHTEVIEAAPEGVMGGASCPCKGECRKADQPPEDAPESELARIDGLREAAESGLERAWAAIPWGSESDRTLTEEIEALVSELARLRADGERLREALTRIRAAALGNFKSHEGMIDVLDRIEEWASAALADQPGGERVR